MKTHRTLSVLFVLAAGLVTAGTARGDSDERSEEELRRVVAEHSHEIRECYEKHALKQREATGKVVLDLVITPEGTVHQVKVDAEGVRGKGFERCTTARVTKWQFSESSHGTEAQFPFLFQHTKI